MITSDLKLSSTLRLLAAFIAIAALTGCHPSLGSFDGYPCAITTHEMRMTMLTALRSPRLRQV
jgi:hypothetical protein